MIFKRLFQRPYQHPEPQKRLESIASLDGQQEKEKQILHELAFNDESVKVSIAALEKLGSFTLWLKAYETHFQQKVQQSAKAVVLRLIEDSQRVDDALFIDIAKQNKHNVLMREMLFSSERLANMPELCVQTLLNICAENEIRRFYNERANDAQKRSIIDQADEKTLRRFKKLDNSEAIASYLVEKLEALEEAAQKPLKLISAATLVNSRLLAITDLHDYESIQNQKNTLIAEFDALKSEFSILSDEQSAQITSKYFSIKEKVDKRLALLEPDYMSHVHLSAITDTISDIRNRATIIFQQIDILTQTDTHEQLNNQVELLARSMADLRLELADIQGSAVKEDLANGGPSGQTTAAHRSAINALEKDFTEHQTLLKNLPEAVARNAQVDALLSQASALLLSLDTSVGDKAREQNIICVGAGKQEIEQRLGEVVKQLQGFSKSGLNKQRVGHIQAFVKAISTKQKERLHESKRLEKRCFAKLNTCLSMIDQGKFKAAIATFHTLQKLIDEIENKSASLSRRFDELTEKVTELKDWQSYIATPKKPELIDAATKLIANENIDIAERATLVKQYRAEFVSLGRLHTQQDDALNQAFDEAIEQAFAPCRAHFAKLDQVREENLKKGEQIISALEALTSVQDIQNLTKHLSAIATQYRKLGDLDKQARNKLHKTYQSRLKPLQGRVNAFYQENASAKQKLIDKANNLNESVDLVEATTQAKALQTQWKAIGFAGSKQDQVLWQEFRQANDKLFERMQLQINEHKQVIHGQVQDIEEQLALLGGLISNAQQLSDLGKAEALVSQIQVLIYELPPSKQKAQVSALSNQKAALAEKAKGFENKKQRALIDTIFDVLTSYTQALSAEQIAPLPAQFRSAFEANSAIKDSQSVLSDLTRKQISMAADILLAEGAAFAESTEKKDVQLKLMAAKLEGQSMPDADTILQQWISLGVLSSEDIKQLEILKACYVNAK